MVNAGGMFQKDGRTNTLMPKSLRRPARLRNGCAYRSGILQGAPRTPATRDPNLVDPTMAAMSGAMSGFGFGGRYLTPGKPDYLFGG